MRLTAKIEATNAANAALNEFAPKVIEALKPFVGQKILVASGGFTAKVAKVLPALPNSHNLMLWISVSRYSICLYSKANRPNSGFSVVYAERGGFVAEIDGANLTKVLEFQPVKADYKKDDILAAREQVKKAKALLSHTENGLAGFGEYDS